MPDEFSQLGVLLEALLHQLHHVPVHNAFRGLQAVQGVGPPGGLELAYHAHQCLIRHVVGQLIRACTLDDACMRACGDRG